MAGDAYEGTVRQKTQNKKKTTRLASSGWELYWLQGLLTSLSSLSHKLPPKLPSLLKCCALPPAPPVSEAVPGMSCYHLCPLSLQPLPCCSEQRLFAQFPPLTRSPTPHCCFFIFWFLTTLYTLPIFSALPYFILLNASDYIRPILTSLPPPKILHFFCFRGDLAYQKHHLPCFSPSPLFPYTFPCYAYCCLRDNPSQYSVLIILETWAEQKAEHIYCKKCQLLPANSSLSCWQSERGLKPWIY